MVLGLLRQYFRECLQLSRLLTFRNVVAARRRLRPLVLGRVRGGCDVVAASRDRDSAGAKRRAAAAAAAL